MNLYQFLIVPFNKYTRFRRGACQFEFIELDKVAVRAKKLFNWTVNLTVILLNIVTKDSTRACKMVSVSQLHQN